jgi:exopolysaccharide biosynthesis operon protein EpsL
VPPVRSPPLPVLLACLCLLCIPARVQALGNDTVFLRAFGNVTYDSNVFRISDEFPTAAATDSSRKDDWIYGLGAGLRLDIPVSQQRFKLDASATQYKYSEFDQLDYTGYAVRGEWDWKAGERWSGQVNLGARQERQAYSNALFFSFPSLVERYDARASARYALTTRWELDGGLSKYASRYDNELLQFDDFDSDSYFLGAAYRSPAGNSTGARLRYERGDWANRPSAPPANLDNQYRQYTLEAVVDWAISGKSRLAGELGYTWRDRDDAIQRDFDGPSGRLTYIWEVTGKSTLQGAVYRTLGAIDDFNATYTQTDGIDLAYAYDVSAKVVANATASYRILDYEGTSFDPSQPQREDKLRSLTLGASYELTRTITLSAGARYEKRTSNIRFADYDVYTVYGTAGIEF